MPSVSPLPDSNPFLDPAFAIRWSAHEPKFIVPAIEEALAGAQAAIDKIAHRPLAEVTFENTFLALEGATELLNFAWGKVTHLQSVNDSPALREAHNAMLPRVSAFFAKIHLNTDLWARLKAFASSTAANAVTGVYRRFLDETLADFRQAGADLPDGTRLRVEKIEGELAELTQKYSENVLDATNAWELVIEDEARLAGLPEHAIAAARQSALDKGFGAGGGGGGGGRKWPTSNVQHRTSNVWGQRRWCRVIVGKGCVALHVACSVVGAGLDSCRR